MSAMRRSGFLFFPKIPPPYIEAKTLVPSGDATGFFSFVEADVICSTSAFVLTEKRSPPAATINRAGVHQV